MPPLWQVFGRLHPLVLHMPIGLLGALLVLEFLCARGLVQRGALRVFVWITALAAGVTAASGWVLSHEEGYGGEVLERHEWLGIAVAALAFAAALLCPRAGSGVRLGLYRAALVAACVLLVPAGDLGATLTHGADWLMAPLRLEPQLTELAIEPAVESEQVDGELATEPPPIGSLTRSAASTYATLIAPIFAARCTKCHGEEKHKGGLRLHTPQGIAAGGEDGPVIVAGDPAASLLVQLVSLPLEHEEHMPPEGKPQPTAEEIATLVAWVAAGAPFEGHVELELSAPPADAALPSTEGTPAEDDTDSEGAPPASERQAQGSSAPDADALAALAAALVHVEPLTADADLLWIDVAAVAPAIDDAELARLLEPLLANVGDLALARSAITDASLALVARSPRLARLDLRATAVTTVAALAGHAALEKLVLAQTRLDDSALETLLGLPALTTVVLWRSGLSEQALARLRSERPELTVLAGDDAAPSALETEGELSFTSERPVPGSAAAPAPPAPVNTSCPVSGNPVKPEYAIVFKGRVIGFCCPNCPRDFWADPARYEAKLP